MRYVLRRTQRSEAREVRIDAKRKRSHHAEFHELGEQLLHNDLSSSRIFIGQALKRRAGGALRPELECFQFWNIRRRLRGVQRLSMNIRDNKSHRRSCSPVSEIRRGGSAGVHRYGLARSDRTFGVNYLVSATISFTVSVVSIPGVDALRVHAERFGRSASSPNRCKTPALPPRRIS